VSSCRATNAKRIEELKNLLFLAHEDAVRFEGLARECRDDAADYKARLDEALVEHARMVMEDKQ
jgi:hypothetical protein